MPTNAVTPPGAPGIPPRWTSSAKSGVGTAAGRGSRVWFVLRCRRIGRSAANFRKIREKSERLH